MVTNNSSPPLGPGSEDAYSEVIAELAVLAAHTQDPAARATFELLARMFRTLSAGHDTFTALDGNLDTDCSKPQ